jgi:hypothetical protein
METLVGQTLLIRNCEIKVIRRSATKERSSGQDYKKRDLVYAVKHDGRHKARLVAGGHLTETPVDSVYSSVVSLRGIRIITFISELNGCDTEHRYFLCLPRVIHPRESVHCCWSRIRRARRTLSSLSRRYMAYDPPDYDGHKDSLTYYAIWDSSYLKEQGHLDARLRRPLRVHSCVR